MHDQGDHEERAHVSLVSIVVNNYNYGRFLAEAIDSALEQTYAPVEVVVVDDGSTDDSRSVIESYGSRVGAVLKENGGQGSAFNTGFAAARGDVVIFLDADDMLIPTAVERAVERFSDGVVKVHWPLWEIDAAGVSSGRTVPSEPLPDGDLRELTFREGPSSSISPPTTGNAWARSYLDQVMPMSESGHRIGADAFLFGLAPAFGRIERVTQPQGHYRLHGANNYRGRGFEDRLGAGLCSVEEQWRVLEAQMHALGRAADRARWESGSHFHRLREAMRQIDALADEEEALILADEGKWGLDPIVRGRRVLPFLECEGDYWGLPVDDAQALVELQRLRVKLRATKLIIGWPAFWWLDHYAGFAAHLRKTFPCLVSNERLVVFDLRA